METTNTATATTMTYATFCALPLGARVTTPNGLFEVVKAGDVAKQAAPGFIRILDGVPTGRPLSLKAFHCTVVR